MAARDAKRLWSRQRGRSRGCDDAPVLRAARARDRIHRVYRTLRFLSIRMVYEQGNPILIFTHHDVSGSVTHTERIDSFPQPNKY